MVQGQVFLKGGGGGGVLTLFLFNFFNVYHFYIYKLLYPLQNKIFLQHNFAKKGHSKLSKNEPENIP